MDRRARLKERLGLKGLGCCGVPLGLGPTTITPQDDVEIETYSSSAAAAPGMNLAAALSAERQLRASDLLPARVSLMRLLEEETEEEDDDVLMCCCVCMGRKKGAAFIPCGHTFCRVCSRDLWLNRGSCPLCNRQILEILDIY